jgi:hypothetical protein
VLFEETWPAFLEAVVGIGAHPELVFTVVTLNVLLVGVVTRLPTTVIEAGDASVFTGGELNKSPVFSFSWPTFAGVSFTPLLLPVVLPGSVFTVDGFLPLGLGVPGSAAPTVGEAGTVVGVVPVVEGLADNFGALSGF